MGWSGEESHYVLVIHGTGAAPEPGKPAWHQFDPAGEDNFCRQLDEALGELGWRSSVWRRPPGWDGERGRLAFAWSGGNSHEARKQGAAELDGLLRRIREADPRCRIHLVAHSHGGNVVLAALDSYLGWMRHLAGAEPEEAAVSGEDAWARGLDPEFHRLGRLVFLGTPFYFKCWLKGTGWLARALAAGRNWLFSLLFFFGFIYLLVQALAGLVSLLPWFGFIGWAPWHWPWPVIVGWALPALLATLGGSQDERHRDVNLYFPGYLDVGELLLRRGKARPLESLVVSAGFLDEALLVLSAQPLASAFLLPSLREVVRPRWWRWLKPVRTGARNEPPEKLARLVKGTLLVVVNLLSLPVTALRALLARPLGAWLAGRTRTALGSAALGVPAWELEDARIEVRSRLDEVPGLLTATSWDIERRLAVEEAPARESAPSHLYPFLWDEEKLDERLAESQVWGRVSEELPAVLRRLGRLEESNQQSRIQRLQRICLVLEERGREIVDSIALLHSAYYARPGFVDAIARFLATGEAPDETEGGSSVGRPAVDVRD
jgi:hypothetical protein